jgi:DNA-binding response OmpR family regulator
VSALAHRPNLHGRFATVSHRAPVLRSLFEGRAAPATGTAGALLCDMSIQPLVLLAEDDVDLRQLISARLVREGMQVVEVDNGIELHDYLVQRSEGTGPDVVVSDVDMPGQSGPEALERAQVRAPVILITAAPTPAVRAAAIRAGVFAILEKPFALPTLVAKIREILHRMRFAPEGVQA